MPTGPRYTTGRLENDHSEYANFELSKLLTLSADKTWCLWDTKTSSPKLSLKVKLDSMPNTCISLASSKVIVGDVTSKLKIYSIKA